MPEPSVGDLRFDMERGVTDFWTGKEWILVGQGNLCRALSVPFDYPVEKLAEILAEDNPPLTKEDFIKGIFRERAKMREEEE